MLPNGTEKYKKFWIYVYICILIKEHITSFDHSEIDLQLKATFQQWTLIVRRLTFLNEIVNIEYIYIHTGSWKNKAGNSFWSQGIRIKVCVATKLQQYMCLIHYLTFCSGFFQAKKFIFVELCIGLIVNSF